MTWHKVRIREVDGDLSRRRRVVAGTTALGGALLGASLSREPGSKAFYALTLTLAGTWTSGSLASGPLQLGWTRWTSDPIGRRHRPVAAPIATGVAAFATFYGAALVARRVPVLDRALRRALEFAGSGDRRLVPLTAAANGLAEEAFFRGALYTALADHHPVAASTAVYTLATVPSRNPALVLAAAAMGTLFALQRRASGGVQAPALTHLTWSLLMLRFLPPLFEVDAPPPASEPAAT